MSELGEKMDYKPLVINWRKTGSIAGGTIIVQEQIANLLGAEVHDLAKAASAMSYGIRDTYYNHAIIDRAIIFDKYIKRFLKVNGADFVVRNSMCGGFYKHNIPMITVFQDPSLAVNEFLVSQGNNTWENEYGHTYPLLQRETAKNSLVVANSLFMEKQLKRIGIETDVVVPLGVDLEVFKPKEVVRTPEQKEYKKTAIWVGKHHPLKWTFMPELINANPDIYWILVIGGETPIKQPQLENVEVLRNVPHHKMADLYNRADFHISTSPIESFGFVTMEAMACGIPTIGFKTGVLHDLKELYGNEDFKGGVIVENHSLDAFMEAIKQIKEGTFSPREVAQNYSLKEFNKKMKETILDYVEEQKKKQG